MLLRDLVDVSAAVTATRARTAKTEAIAGLLAGAAPGEAGPAVAFLAGRLTQRQIGVGYAQLRDLPAPGEGGTLTVAEVDATFAAVGELRGPGSQAARRDALAALFSRAGDDEQRFLRRLLLGDLIRTSELALTGGRQALAAVRLTVGRPLSPMLAGTAPDVAAALERTGRAAVEHKLDGARVQVHRDGGDVAVFTRT